jgi:UDP-N-acetylglucosamine acyltransferase
MRKSNTIHPTAIIGEGVDLGKGNYIGPYCLIGGPCESRANWGKEGKVIIGDNNTFTGLVTIDAGMENVTVIGSNTFWMKHSHGGHDCVVGDGVTVSCGAKIGGHAFIGKETNIGLNAVIHQRIEVPQGCMIGANAFIGKKTQMRDGYKYAGVPARELGENKR